MSKGSWTRVSNRIAYERRKERVFLSTRDLCLRLGWRFGELQDDSSAEYKRYAGLVYDVSCIVDEKAEQAKQIRRELLRLHEELDNREDNNGQA